jgi:hypothetical protein
MVVYWYWREKENRAPFLLTEEIYCKQLGIRAIHVG